MTSNEIFESQLNSSGSFAGVYEHDDRVGYFYLYDLARPEGQKVTGALRVSVGPILHKPDEVEIRWSADDVFVGLFVKESLCAAFNAKTREAFGNEGGSTLASVKSAFFPH